MLRLVLSVLLLFCMTTDGFAREKVILDSDMVEGFDDGVALALLSSTPEIELLGVTIVAGNSWVPEGTAFAIRQLEILGHPDIPVYMGLTRPLRGGRVEEFEFEAKMFGITPEIYTGALTRPDPGDWREVYRKRYNREPDLEPEQLHAVNYLIETIRNNPGEITIIAIGPAGNLALAARLAPDIVPLVKRVVYMGGAFFQQGNVTPAAEFNWWFDPEAIKIAIRMPFKEQIVFGLDACEKVKFTRGHFHAILEMLGEHKMADILRNSDVGQDFINKPTFFQYIWDALPAASLIEPSLVLNFEKRYVDVVDSFGLSYGHSLAYEGEGPVGTQEVIIVTDINKDRLWEMLLDKNSWLTNSEVSGSKP